MRDLSPSPLTLSLSKGSSSYVCSEEGKGFDKLSLSAKGGPG